MPRINDNVKDKKVSANVKTYQKLSFTFHCLTNDKKHGFEYFRKDMRNMLTAYKELIDKISELCTIMNCEARGRGKIQGSEPIPYCRLKNSMKSVCDRSGIVTKDSMISVFRFCNNDYRLMCKTDILNPNVLHILGFDFDHSAYDHGS